MDTIILLILLVVLFFFVSSNKEHFTQNITIKRLLPYRKVNELVDNKNLQKNINNLCGKTDILKQDNNNNHIKKIRHYIGIQCLKTNPVIYLSKEAIEIDTNKPFDFLTNHNKYNLDINNYYHQLYSRINHLFFNLNNKICEVNTKFTILILDIILRDETVYVDKFSYYNKEDAIVKRVYNDLYRYQINNNYIKIYPKQNTFNKF